MRYKYYITLCKNLPNLYDNGKTHRVTADVISIYFKHIPAKRIGKYYIVTEQSKFHQVIADENKHLQILMTCVDIILANEEIAACSDDEIIQSIIAACELATLQITKPS